MLAPVFVKARRDGYHRTMRAVVQIPSLADPESARLTAEMIVAAQEMAACPDIETFATTGWLRDAFFEALDRFYAAYETYISHNIAASQLRIQCKIGCNRCCWQMVHGLYGFEIVSLYRLLRGRADYERIHTTFLQQALQFESMRKGATPSNEEEFRRALRQYAAAGNPCALLADSKCIAYAQRPTPCRMYHSLTDPILCVTPKGHTFNLEVPAAASQVLDALDARLAVPYSALLAQGLVAFGAKRRFRPWGAPVASGASA